MDNRIISDARNLRKLIREAEGLADEAIMAMARLKQAMLSARQNPMVEVSTGQRALLRLTEAESHALSMSTNLLRVHDELNKVATTHAGGDIGDKTIIVEGDLNALPARQPREMEQMQA